MNASVMEKLKNYFGKFRFAVHDDKKNTRWIIPATEKNIKYLKAMNALGMHIYMQPEPEAEPFFMLCDDLRSGNILQHHMNGKKFRPGRLITETSPENFQIWIHSDRALSNEEKRYWLKRMKSDPGAVPKDRWGRSPGFRNRKKKYRNPAGEYPLSRLIWIDYAKKASIPPAGFPFTPSPKAERNIGRGSVSSKFSSEIPKRNRYESGDESQTDFRFVLALLRRKCSEDEIRERLLAERQNWEHHKGRIDRYITATIMKAKEIINE